MTTTSSRQTALRAKHARQTQSLLARQARAREQLKRKQADELEELGALLACETQAVKACSELRIPKARPSKDVKTRPRRSLPAAPPRGATLTDVQDFADAVERSAENQGPAHRFGDQVFLGPIFRRMLVRREVKSREHFRLMLQLARQRGLLQLSRADLVSAMDPALVRESEFRDMNATWHLLTPRIAPAAGLQASGFEAEFRRAFNAARARAGGRNLVSLRVLREALPGYDRGQFDRGLWKLRYAGLYSLSAHEGRTGALAPKDAEAGIREGGRLLVYAQAREG